MMTARTLDRRGMTSPFPLQDLHVRSGARLGEAGGYVVPMHYGDPAVEHEAVRQRVGVIDRSSRGKIETTGRDRVSFLQGMLSNDVKALSPGEGCPAAFLDARGKIVSLLAVHCLPDRLVLEMERGLVAPTLAALDRFLISERVEFEDLSERLVIVTLAGPVAHPTVEKILGRAVPELRPYQHVQVTVEGLDARIARSEESGEATYDLWVVRDGLARLWERAVGLGVQPVGRQAWNVLRVEAGAVWHGVDVDASTLLLEAPLDHTYSLNKGCYIGQEVVARISYRGHVNRKIVGFVFSPARCPASGDRIAVEGNEVGRVTSAIVSPALGRGLALGFLRREHWEPGTKVEILAEGGPLTAEVASLPFYRRVP